MQVKFDKEEAVLAKFNIQWVYDTIGKFIV